MDSRPKIKAGTDAAFARPGLALEARGTLTPNVIDLSPRSIPGEQAGENGSGKTEAQLFLALVFLAVGSGLG